MTKPLNPPKVLTINDAISKYGNDFKFGTNKKNIPNREEMIGFLKACDFYCLIFLGHKSRYFNIQYLNRRSKESLYRLYLKVKGDSK